MENAGDNWLIGLSQAIGALVILGSLTVKVPVILNVLNYRSSKGLSASSIYFEVLALTCNSAYNGLRGSPLSAWAECVSVLLQDFVLIALVWRFSQQSVSGALAALTTYVAFLSTVLSLRGDTLLLLPLCTTTIGMCGLIPQILENRRNGHTGALSVVTQGLNVAGAFARVFTTIQLVKDSTAIVSVSISTVLHTVILLQILFMRENTKQAMAKLKTN